MTSNPAVAYAVHRNQRPCEGDAPAVDAAWSRRLVAMDRVNGQSFNRTLDRFTWGRGFTGGCR